MVKRPRQDVMDHRESDELQLLVQQLAETQNALAYANQQIGCMKVQMQDKCISKVVAGGDVVKSLTRQEFHQGSETQGYSSIQKAFTAHGLKELQNTVAKLGEAVQTLTRAQSEKELRFDSLAKGLVQTKHDLTLKIEGESRKFSKSVLNLETANKALQTDLEQCKSDVTSLKEENADLKLKLINARSNLTNANENIEGLQTELTRSKCDLSTTKQQIEGLTHQLSDAISNQKNADANIEGLQRELAKSKCGMKATQKEIEGLRTELSEAKSGLANFHIEIEGMRSKLADCEDQISKVSQAAFPLGLPKQLSDAMSNQKNADANIEGLRTELSEAKSGLENSNMEIDGIKSKLVDYENRTSKDPQIAQCLKACIPSVKWNENGNVQKIEIQGKWHNLGELLHSPATETNLVQMKAAMRMCKTWPKTLDFRRTGLNASLAKDVADIMNEHPTGFERLCFWDEPGLKNDGLKAIVDNLDARALQNVKTIRLYCGLSGQKGGQIIHTFLEKCGNSLDCLQIGAELGQDGWAAAFSPFENANKKIAIDTLWLQDEFKKEEVWKMLKNCQVANFLN
eukprot:Platyproteum_vivax@DN7659_c1_g1_i11.p1